MKPLLILHGAIGAKEQFNDLSILLKEKFEIHTFNFSGHGSRDIPAEPFSIEMFAGEILNYINEKNLAPLDIFGYSMGGYAALYAAALHPKNIGKIFTLATKFGWSAEIAEREVKMLDAEKIKARVPKFAEELSKRHGADKWEKVLDKTAEMMISLGNKNMLTQEVLSKLPNEVLLGIGDSDKMVSLEEIITAYKSMPNAELVVLPGTPHPIEQVEKERLAFEIRQFFNKELNN